MKRRKILSVLLVTVMTATMLFGCGKKNDTPADTTGNSSGGEGAANTGSTGEAADSSEKVTVTFMLSGTLATEGEDFETEQMPRLVEKKFPNVKVEVTKLPDDQYYTALKTKLATGEAPDFMWVQPRYAGVNAVFPLAEAGYLTDLSDLKAAELVGAGVKDFTYNDKIYAIPCGVTFLGTYYNKNIFDKYGLSVPKSWPEFENVCKVLKDNDVQPIVMGDKDMYVMQFGLYQLAANMIYPENPTYDDQLRDGSVKFTDEGTWDKVLERYGSLYEKGYIQSGSLGLGASQAIQKFIDGECAMTFDGTFNLQAINSSGAADFERGYFPLPGNEEGEQLYTAGAPGAGPAIYSESENIDICKQILEYWFDSESDLYKAYESCGKFVSTNEGAVVEPLYEDFMKLYSEGNSWYWCNQAWPAGTENEMEALFGEMIGGAGTTVPDITKGMQNKLEELLAE